MKLNIILRVALWALSLALLIQPVSVIASTDLDEPPGTPQDLSPNSASRLPEGVTVLDQQRGLGNDFSWLLPDLKTMPPSDLRLLVSQGGKRKLFRFSNTVWNSGPGDLEMNGVHDSERDVILITQLIHRLNGDTAGRRIGESIFHPSHNHWHFSGFAIYEIWTATPEGEMLEMVQSSGKVGYCARVDRRVEFVEIGVISESGSYPGRERALYTGCHREYQGMSVGWKDIYRHHLPGQDLDISHLPDGLYAIKSTVNPDGQIIERNLDNNTNATYFLLAGNRLVLVEGFPVDLS